MPTIHVEMFEGRTPEQRSALAQALTEATVQALGVKPDSVDIVITEVAKTHWATGGVLWSERKPGA